MRLLLLAVLASLAAAAPVVNEPPSPPAVCQPSPHPIECYVVPGDGDYTDPHPSAADFNMCITFTAKGEQGVRYQGLSYGVCTNLFSNASLVGQLSSYSLCNTALCNAPSSRSSAVAVGAAAALGVALFATLF